MGTQERVSKILSACGVCSRRAAEALNLSQPAVSKHIQALEAQYGAKLFDYSGRRLSRTRAGELLEQYVSTLRYNEEKLIAAMHARPETLLRIGATKSIGDYILLPEIRRFLSAPGNRLTFLVDNTAHLLSMLDAGELDFAVLEGIFDKRQYDSFLFRPEPYIGVCAADHPFAGREVSLSELFDERLILRESGSGTRKILERELSQLGYTTEMFRATICISSFKIIRELVANGLGVSFLYEAVVGQDAQFGHFCCPPLTGSHELNVVYLKNTPAARYAHAFLSSHP